MYTSERASLKKPEIINMSRKTVLHTQHMIMWSSISWSHDWVESLLAQISQLYQDTHAMGMGWDRRCVLPLAPTTGGEGIYFDTSNGSYSVILPEDIIQLFIS